MKQMDRTMAWVGLLLFSILLFPAIADCGEPPLRVATDDWPPYEYAAANGETTGFSAEVFRAVMKRMDLAVGSIAILPWARCEKMLARGDLDAIFSANPSEKRKAFSRFPKASLIDSPNVLFIRKENRDKLRFDALSDLKGKHVGIVRGYA